MPLQVHKITKPTINLEKSVDRHRFFDWHTRRELSTGGPFLLEDSYQGTVTKMYQGDKGKPMDAYVSERHLAAPDGSIEVFAVKHLGSPYNLTSPRTSLYFPPLSPDSIDGYRAEFIQITDPKEFYLKTYDYSSAAIFNALEMPITDDNKIQAAWDQLRQ
ncbi:hypothetical protein HY212_01280 [Candidatus Pacearchaeota archaeon]|nr:hypothetical protein [Candidatus Pacearchaeota archaeon]